LEDKIGIGHERFAHFAPRLDVAFQQQRAKTGFGHQRRGRRPARPAADDNTIIFVRFGLHYDYRFDDTLLRLKRAPQSCRASRFSELARWRASRRVSVPIAQRSAHRLQAADSCAKRAPARSATAKELP